MALESAQDSDSVAAIFRSMHTIKATSGFFGFALVEQVGHVAENLLGRIRSRLEQLTEERDEAQEAIAPSVGAASTVSASVAVMTVIAPRNRNARFTTPKKVREVRSAQRWNAVTSTTRWVPFSA